MHGLTRQNMATATMRLWLTPSVCGLTLIGASAGGRPCLAAWADVRGVAVGGERDAHQQFLVAVDREAVVGAT